MLSGGYVPRDLERLSDKIDWVKLLRVRDGQ